MNPNAPDRRCAPGVPQQTPTLFAISPMIPSEFKFTVERIEKLSAPTHGELTFRDTEVRGLQIRLRSSGAGTYEVRYRVGGGRTAPMRRHTIGSRQQISLATARRIAGEVLAKARAGHDPAGERRAIAIKARNEARARAQSVVDAYIDHLRSDGVVAANQIASLLRRELLEPLGRERNLSTVSRAELMARVDAIATNGRKGSRASVSHPCPRAVVLGGR
jgi:mRNA-degrading endonuclease toxin of MazEF toxin-antitoxin module